MCTVWYIVCSHKVSYDVFKPYPLQFNCYFCGSPGLNSNRTALPACKAYSVANGLSVVTLEGGCGVLDYNVGTCLCKSTGQVVCCLQMGLDLYVYAYMCVCVCVCYTVCVQ